jgi:diaminopimelate decarboxylase
VGEGVLSPSPPGGGTPLPESGGGAPAAGERPPGFPRREGVLHCREQDLGVLAERWGTPLYVYDGQGIRERVEAFQRAFQEVDFLLAYSVKANGNLAVLNRIGALGGGADIVSLGELHRALRAGIPAERIVFAGVGKTEEEMEAALKAGILSFHVESAGELQALEGVAARVGRPAPVGIRVNPDILVDTPHEYTRTGHAASKFGVALEDAMVLYRRAHASPHLEVRGVDVHIGSQILEVEPYLEALDTVLAKVARLAAQGVPVGYLDLGGGFGVGYGGDPGLPVEALAREIVPRLRGTGLRLLLEPGRSVVGEAGILLTRVLYVKRAGGKTFVITDGGMTELLRPSHYGGWHQVLPVHLRPSAPVEPVDVVGPVCESGDFLALDRPLPLPRPGDLLAVATAGAYGFTMASNYNARRRPAEVLVEGAAVHLVRRRETLDDLLRGEEIPPLPEAGSPPAPPSVNPPDSTPSASP